MSIFLIILASLLWLGAFVALPKRVILGPALSFCALTIISFASSPEGFPYFPVGLPMLMSWLCMTLLVLITVIMQSPAVRAQSRGVIFMEVGGVAGMLVGLACSSLLYTLGAAYACMIAGTIAGIILGYLLFAYTPRGEQVRPGSGHFFTYLPAKGFPALVTIAQLGVMLTILLFNYNMN